MEDSWPPVSSRLYHETDSFVVTLKLFVRWKSLEEPVSLQFTNTSSFVLRSLIYRVHSTKQKGFMDFQQWVMLGSLSYKAVNESHLLFRLNRNTQLASIFSRCREAEGCGSVSSVRNCTSPLCSHATGLDSRT